MPLSWDIVGHSEDCKNMNPRSCRSLSMSAAGKLFGKSLRTAWSTGPFGAPLMVSLHIDSPCCLLFPGSECQGHCSLFRQPDLCTTLVVLLVGGGFTPGEDGVWLCHWWAWAEPHHHTSWLFLLCPLHPSLRPFVL